VGGEKLGGWQHKGSGSGSFMYLPLLALTGISPLHFLPLLASAAGLAALGSPDLP